MNVREKLVELFYDNNVKCDQKIEGLADDVMDIIANGSNSQRKKDDVRLPRISKDAYYLEIAKAVAMRSTCLRRQYGAVIVKNDRIISTGYNGSARGEPNCCDVGECWRDSHGIPHGEQYEKCVAVHAEDNAISHAGREAIGATLYLAGFENGKPIVAVPCAMCERKIKNAQIHKVIT